MCPLKRTVTRQILSYVYKKVNVNLQQIRIQEFSLKSDAEPSENTAAVDRFKSFVPFDQILEERRREASRSIIVEVKNKKSCNDLLTYCLNFGTIKNAIYYSLDNKHNYTIIEYNDFQNAQAALSDATHVHGENMIPVNSSYLFFRLARESVAVRSDIPMLRDEDNTLPCKSDLKLSMSDSNSFSDDMKILYKRTKLTDTGARLRFITAMQIETALKGMFPMCKVLPFGSSINSYGKVNCDLDLVWNLNSAASLSEYSRLGFQAKMMDKFGMGDNQTHLEITADLLSYLLPGCSNVRRILRARVPIIKYKQNITGIECDLSATNMSGVYMSELLYLFSAYDTRVCPLVFAVRFWAREINLTNPAPGKWISNFSLTLLVLFFLQYEKLIPTLDTLARHRRPHESKMVGEDECGFLTDLRLLENPGTMDNKDDLMQLLFRFFGFYSSFDFRSSALSLNTGSMIPKPTHATLYIVNPLEKGLNVSRNVSPEECEKMRMECRIACQCIEGSMPSIVNNSCGKKFGLLDLLESRLLNKSGFAVARNMKGSCGMAVKDILNKKSRSHDHDVKS